MGKHVKNPIYFPPFTQFCPLIALGTKLFEHKFPHMISSLYQGEVSSLCQGNVTSGLLGKADFLNTNYGAMNWQEVPYKCAILLKSDLN